MEIKQINISPRKPWWKFWSCKHRMGVVYISGDYVYCECKKCGYREIVHKDDKTLEFKK